VHNNRALFRQIKTKTYVQLDTRMRGLRTRIMQKIFSYLFKQALLEKMSYFLPLVTSHKINCQTGPFWQPYLQRRKPEYNFGETDLFGKILTSFVMGAEDPETYKWDGNADYINMHNSSAPQRS